MEILCIFIGGALGALVRYLVMLVFDGSVNSVYPYLSTFLVNMLGCFVFGFAVYIFGRNKTVVGRCLKNFLTVGFAACLTTFSTFVMDLYNLIILGKCLWCAVYMISSVLLGLCFVSVGINSAYSFMVRLIRMRKSEKQKEF